MRYSALDMPVLGMNRRIDSTKLPPGMWRTLVNLDIYNQSWRRRKGSSQLHTPGSGGVPAGCTIWDFLEAYEEELAQDKMLLVLEDSVGATKLWSKERAAGGSYGNFAQRTWCGVLASWSDNLLGTSFPYPKIIKLPRSYRIIPTDADSDAEILFYRQYDSGCKLFEKTGFPATLPNDQHLFTEARLIEPREIPVSEIKITGTAQDGSEGDLGPYTTYYYGYTLVYEDGQESLPWFNDSRTKIPDDIYFRGTAVDGTSWFMAGVVNSNSDDELIELHIEVDAINLTTPTAIPLRIAGINVWRAKMTGVGEPGVKEILSDFHLLGFVSFGRTGAIGDYYETLYALGNVTPTNPSGNLKRFDVGLNLTSSGTRWNSSETLSPVNAAIKITAVDGDSSHALVGNVYSIESHGTPTDQDIDVYDHQGDLSTSTPYSAVFVDGILAYQSDGDYHAQLLDNMDDISANPEMWSYLGVTPGELSLKATGKHGSVIRGRMFLANCYIEDEHYPAMVCASIHGKHDSFASIYQMNFDWDGGEPIVGPIIDTGMGMLIFKERQVGFFALDEDDIYISTAQVQILKEDGLASAEAIIEAGDYVFFAGNNAIWAFREGYGFLKISEGQYSQDDPSIGAIQKIFDNMHNDDKALASAYYVPETRKVGFCVPIVNGTYDWDDILDPVLAHSSFNDSYVSFEFDFIKRAWSLADPAIRKARMGVGGELFTTDFTDIDQQLADFGSEQETHIRAFAEPPWLGGFLAKIIGFKSKYKDGSVLISVHKDSGQKILSVTMPDTKGETEDFEDRFGVAGNPLWIAIETENESEIISLELAGRLLKRVVERDVA